MTTATARMAGSLKGASVSPPRKEPDKKKYSGRLAARIRALREKADMTIEQLAGDMQRAGYEISAPTLYHWENGQRQPQLDALPYVAKVLRVELTELFPKK